MIKADTYIYRCSTSDDIPSDTLRMLVHPEIEKSLGKPISEMFPEFAAAFPRTITEMEKTWPSLIVVYKQIRANWYPYLLSERADLNLFFDLRSVRYPISGPDYDRDHAMLRPKWRELYRWFESFVITASSTKPMKWWNTPFNYSGRLNLDEYRQGSGASKSQVRDFRKQIGSNQLMCWLLTDAGDALFIDEEHCDQKVYHVQGTAFEDVIALVEPDFVLDSYLAHYIAGNSAKDFNFRITT